MLSTFKKITLTLTLLALPVTAMAQTDTGTTNDAITTTTESDGVAGNEVQRNDSSFPWGLLGLLGLAGLAGRRKEERTEVRLGGPTDGPRR